MQFPRFLVLLSIIIVIKTTETKGISNTDGSKFPPTATTTTTKSKSVVANNKIPTRYYSSSHRSTTTTTIKNKKEEENNSMTTAITSSSTGNENENNYEYEYEINKELDEMPLLPITSDDTILACRNMDTDSPFQHDIFICSYPKSGTTWTQNIVVRLLLDIAKSKNTKKNNEKPIDKEEEEEEKELCEDLPDDWHLSHSAPFYEVDQYWRRCHRSLTNDINNNDDDDDGDGSNTGGTTNTAFERIPVKTPIVFDDDGQENEYRVFNTHLRPTQLPIKSKCIYIIRHPLDVMISFYHHLSNQSIEDGGYTGGSLDEFCKEFMDGTILYGKWPDHIEAWLGSSNNNRDCDGRDGRGDGENKKKKKTNFLLLHYEDMKKNLERETKRIAEFLLETNDDDHDNDNKYDDNDNKHDDDDYINKLVSRVVPYCTFSAMKDDKKKYTPLTVSWKINPTTGTPYNEFVRNGNVGDGSRECPEELQKRWYNCDTKIAKERWKNANIHPQLSDRYLS